MEELSEKDLMKLWQKGKPLNKAIWVYCDNELLTQYSQIKLPDSSANNDYSIQKAAENLLKISHYQSNKKNALIDLYNNLYEKVLSGKLFALGYKSPIESDYPAIIPPHMWPPESVEPNKSNISSNNIEYVRVRILKTSRIKNKEAQKRSNNKVEIVLPDTELSDKFVGRPSIKPLINEAYEILKQQGKIDFTKRLISHTELIQDTVRQLHPEISKNKGMQYETIRRTIGEQFEEDKKSSKLSSKL